MTCLDAPSVLVQLVERAQQLGASDIHLQRLGNSAQVTLRLDGVLTSFMELGDDIAERVFGRIKFLAKLKTYQDCLPQDGRIEKAALGTESDIRVATYPTITGEKIVLRLFTGRSVTPLAELGLAADVEHELRSFLGQNGGLLLLTGPAGSGKTTTIYACLRHLVELGGRHIITIEDPAEQTIPGVMQTEVNEARGLSFGKAARHLLRQDPQVLVIGEIRDEETANLVIRAALTGHMVLATLHAGCCRRVFERLLLLCDDRYAAVSAIELILNQRLVRRVCMHCAGQGCAVCLSTGYRGRIPLVEWLKVEESLRARVRAEGPNVVQPIHSLQVAARELLDRGLSNEKEVQRVLGVDTLVR